MPFGSLRPSGRIRGYKRLGTAFCLIVMILALTACGLLTPGGKEKKRESAPPPPEASAPQNPAQTQDSAAIIHGQPPLPLQTESPAPADNDNVLEGYTQVPAPVPAPAPPPAPVDPVLAAGPLQLGPDGTMGSLGLNLEDYFTDSADPEDRLTKMERVVGAMQRDLRTLAPPIVRLISVEQDIQELVAQLSQLAQNRSPPGAMSAAYNAVPLHTPPAGAGGAGGAGTSAVQSAAQSGGYANPAAKGQAVVHGLRLGEHKDKTRIVLDVGGAASYRYDLDNGEHLLVIELPDTQWSGKTADTLRKSPVIASWSVAPMEGGSRVIVQLKKETAVTYETVIKPGSGGGDHRIVLDLKK